MLDGSATAPLVLLAMVAAGVGYGAVQSLTLMDALERAGDDTVASTVWNLGFDAGTALGVGVLAAAGLGLGWAFAASSLVLLPALALTRRRGPTSN